METKITSQSSNPRLASVWRRALAYAIDVLLLAAGVLVVQGLLRPVNPLLTSASPTGGAVHRWVLLTVSLPIAIYFAAGWVSRYQATPGMRVLRLVVCSSAGYRLSLPRAVLRAVVLLLPFELNHTVLLYPRPIWTDSPPGFRWGFAAVDLLLLIYLAVALWTPLRQGPHDLVAGTVVQHVDPVA